MMAVTQQSNYASVTQQHPTPSASPYNFMNSAGVYVHSNPPRPLISSSTSTNSTQNTAIRNWIKAGDLDKLENIVLEGQGARLLGLMDSTTDVKVKSFLRGIPGYMAKVDLIHDAVIRGSVRELQTLLDKKKLSLARDAVGRGLAHKAVLHSQRNVLDWLGKKYPESIQIRDNESRTCLHYSGLSKNPTDMYNFLLNLGGNPEVIDIHGRKASYYLTNPQELYIEGVGGSGGGGGGFHQTGSFRGNKSIKRGGGAAAGGGSQFRRRISPISPKSSPSPPTTTSNNLLIGQGGGPQHSSAGSTLKNSFLSMLGPTSPQLTRAQIRIWIHEKDISKLEQIVWSGNGDRLLLETTNNPKVRRFLDNVPYLLHHIKLIHTAAIHNDVEGLKEIRSRIERSRGSGSSTDGTVSISPELFTARDSYGLSAMHKASGLNNRAAVEYLLYEFPATINLQDNFKRTPLHYAAVRMANEPQNSESIYKFLQRTGADTAILDYKQQDAPYYLTRPAECDSFKFLRNIPDAPRVLSSDSLLGWDRSGVPGFAAAAGFLAGGGVGLARGMGNSPGSGGSQKRKISDEFVDSLGGGGGVASGRNAGNKKDANEGDKPGSGGKVARTEEEEREEHLGHEEDFLDEEDDEIRDVGDGYVADSDEGKYDIQAEDVIIGEDDVLVEEDEEAAEETPQPTNENLNNNKKNLSPSPPRSPQKKASLKEEEEENDDNMNVTEAGEEETERNLEELEEEAAMPPPTTPGNLEETSNMDVPEEDQEENDTEMGGATAVPEGEEEEEAEPDRRPSPSPSPPRSPPKTPYVAAAAAVGATAAVAAAATARKSLSQNEMEEKLPPPPDYNDVADPPPPPPPPQQQETEENVDHYLASSDMESLVNLVLRGRGADLVDKTSSNPEIQEFLQNVPAYMAKIATIHKASFTGNMRDLQSLLDRKRLAEAQDGQGRAALHHGILGGHSQIVRYLVNGYPGCIDVKDKDGRTALHYSAVIGDEGVLYKVLIQGGADPNLRDKMGNTPGVYLRRKDLLKMEDLMRSGSRKGSKKVGGGDSWTRPDTPFPPGGDDGGSQPQSPTKNPEKNEEEEERTGVDLDAQETGNQDGEVENNVSANYAELEGEVEQDLILENANNTFPAIWSEEGKYLASVLGDALVKGLSLVSQQRPSDPVEYLANFLRNYKDGDDGNGAGEKRLSGVDAGLLTSAAAAALSSQEELNRRRSIAEKAAQEENQNEEEKMEVGEPEAEKNEEQGEAQKPSTPMEEANEVKVEESAAAAPPKTPAAATAEPTPATEKSLNEDLTKAYDKLEDALDEEESATTPFDPEKEELAEKAMLESSKQFSEQSDNNQQDAEGSSPPLQSSTRDDNGQSVLHFACTRPGGGSTIMAFLQNPSVNLAWRDANMRTARDIAENLNRSENMRVVDNWVMQLAMQGDKETLEALLVDGYQHLADLEDSSGTHIVEVAEAAEQREVALLLRGAPEFKEKVDRVHRCVRSGDIDGLKSLVGEDKRVAFALNPKTGRTAMHVAVLCEEVAIVKWLSEFVPECVKRGDNLERTCLHYAMGVDKVEKIVRILVRAGAKRVVKDLRDRQPSWYFINRDEIGQLQAEERAILN